MSQLSFYNFFLLFIASIINSAMFYKKRKRKNNFDFMVILKCTTYCCRFKMSMFRLL